MRYIVLLCVLLLMVPVALAEDSTTIKDGWFSYTDSFTAQGNEYTIHGGNTYQISDDDVFVRINRDDGIGVHIPLGECAETQTYSWCFLERDWDHNKVGIDSQGRLQPALKLSFIEYSYGTGASISRSIADTTLSWGESTQVEITVKNNGDYPLRFSLIEPVPGEYTIERYDSSFTKLTNNSLIANFILLPDNEWKADYEFMVDSYESLEWAPSITYEPAREEDPGEQKTAKASKKKITVQTPYKLTTTVEKNVLDTQEPQTITVTVKNTDSADIDLLDVEFRVPPGMEVLQHSNLNRAGSYIFRSTDHTLSPESEQTYKIIGKLPFVGEYEVDFSGEVHTQAEVYPFEDTLTFETTTEGLYCSVGADDTIDFIANEPFDAIVTIGNNDDEVFYAINGSFSDDTDAYLENILSNTEKVILERTVTPAFSLDDGTLNLSFEATYISSTGELFTMYCERDFPINPADRLFDVEVTTEQSEARVNETVSFTVRISQAPIAVDDIIIKVGDQERVASIEPARFIEETFTVPVPEFYAESVLTEEVSISTPNGYDVDTEVNFTILDPYDWEEEFDEEDAVEQQEKEVKVKDADDSFFGRLKALIRSIFT